MGKTRPDFSIITEKLSGVEVQSFCKQRPEIPPCATAGFSAIHHFVCIGVISLPQTVAISLWCRVFVDCCLWKPIITEREGGVLLSESDFHAEKVCEAKCNSAELPL